MGAESEPTSDPSVARQRADVDLAQSSGSYELVLSAVIFALIGWAVDRWLGTTPVFILVFTVAGFVGAAASLYYRYKYRISQIEAETAALRTAANGGGLS